MTTRLLAYWKLDGGDLVEESGNFPLTAVGPPPFVQGKLGGAKSFTRAVGAVDTTPATQYGYGEGYNALNAAALGDFTWSAWVKRGTWVAGQIYDCFLIRGSPVNPGGTVPGANVLLIVSMQTTGVFVFGEIGTRNSRSHVFTSAVVPLDGSWHHVTVTRTNSADVRVYLDGEFKELNTYANGFNENGQDAPGIVSLGCRRKPTYYGQFDGGLDDVRFYSGAMTAAEVRALYLDRTQGGPANWETIENVLQAQVTRASGLVGTKVLWDTQELPRPPRPFITLHMSDDLAVSTPEQYQKNNPAPIVGDTGTSPPTVGTELILGTKIDAEFTLTVQAFTDAVVGSASARALLVKVRNAFGADSYTDALYASGISVISVSPVRNLTKVLETKFEGRAALEIRCRVEDGHEETNTYIETVLTTITIDQ